MPMMKPTMRMNVRILDRRGMRPYPASDFPFEPRSTNASCNRVTIAFNATCEKAGGSGGDADDA